MGEARTQHDKAEHLDAIAVGGVVISRERIVVVSDGAIVASFRADGLRWISVVDGHASKRPVREAVWGIGFMVLGVVRVVMASAWWDRLAFVAIALIGVWVSLNLLRRTTQVRLKHDNGRTTILLAGVRLPKDEVASIATRLASELGYRTR